MTSFNYRVTVLSSDLANKSMPSSGVFTVTENCCGSCTIKSLESCFYSYGGPKLLFLSWLIDCNTSSRLFLSTNNGSTFFTNPLFVGNGKYEEASINVSDLEFQYGILNNNWVIKLQLGDGVFVNVGLSKLEECSFVNSSTTTINPNSLTTTSSPTISTTTIAPTTIAPGSTTTIAPGSTTTSTPRTTPLIPCVDDWCPPAATGPTSPINGGGTTTTSSGGGGGTTSNPGGGDTTGNPGGGGPSQTTPIPFPTFPPAVCPGGMTPGPGGSCCSPMTGDCECPLGTIECAGINGFGIVCCPLTGWTCEGYCKPIPISGFGTGAGGV